MPEDIRNAIVVTSQAQESTPVVDISTVPVTDADPVVQKGQAEEPKALNEEVGEVEQHEEFKGFRKKIDKMTAKMSQKEHENALLKQRIEALEKPQVPIDLDDLTVDERITHLANKEARRLMAEQMERQEQRSVQTKAEKEWETKIERVVQSHPDFHEVIEDANIPMSSMVLDAIRNSDFGGEIAYKLATNPEMAYKLASVDPITQSKMLLKLEMEFERANDVAVVPPKVSKAPSATPAPGKPNNGASVNVKDMTMADYINYRKQRGTLK